MTLWSSGYCEVKLRVVSLNSPPKNSISSERSGFGKWYTFSKTWGAVARKSSAEKVFLEISQSLQENTCAGVSILKMLQAPACNLIKKRLWHMFSCGFCEISKNTISCRTPSVVASEKPQPLSQTIIYLT